mgnify:FL=1|jgi:hypothetical protein
MARGKNIGTSFEDTFGSQDDQPYDSTSSLNTWDMSNKAKKDAAYLRGTKLGNAVSGGRPFGK